MSIKNFVVELYIIFLGITLTEAIGNIVESFNYLSAMCFILIFFLAIDFFFAKLKEIGNDSEKQKGLSMVFNLLVVCCFSFMPYFMNSFLGFMIVLVFLRVFDAFLILIDNEWKFKAINPQERRWMAFDISYFIIELIFILMSCFCKKALIDNILITIYLVLGIFEAVFDFVINADKYLSTDNIKDD